MNATDQLWLDSYGFVYSADGKRLLKGASVKGDYWIPEGVEEIEPDAGVYAPPQWGVQTGL